jgi:hypothetical protein
VNAACDLSWGGRNLPPSVPPPRLFAHLVTAPYKPKEAVRSAKSTKWFIRWGALGVTSWAVYVEREEPAMIEANVRERLVETPQADLARPDRSGYLR